MSVLIKGMEMPTSCYACMFFAQTNYWNKEDEADILSHCKRTGEKTWESVNGYLPNCPLVPVPPHGRLIDADALHEELYALEYARENEWFDGVREAQGVDAARVALLDAPTIIEAEEEE